MDSARPLSIFSACASLALALFGVAWFAGSFAAQEARWWNSLGLFVGIFSLGLLLGIVGKRNAVGVFGLVGNALGLAGALLFIFARSD